MKNTFRFKFRGIWISIFIGVLLFSFYAFTRTEATNLDNKNAQNKENLNQEEKNIDKNVEDPQLKTVTIELEGMTEEIEVKKYHNDELGFETYYPADMITVEDQDEVRFYYAIDEEINEEASIRVIKDMNGDLKEHDIADFLTGDGWELIHEKDSQTGRYSWAESKSVFDNTSLEKNAIIFPVKIEDSSFKVILQYQYEYGDGIYPRADIIVDYAS